MPYRCLLLCVAVLSCVSAAEGLERAMVPESGSITLREHGYRDWGPELVRYRIDTARFVPGLLVLRNGQGAVIPFQISDGEIAFVARLDQGQTVTYQLAASASDCSAENSTVQRTSSDGVLEIGNNRFTLRLPALQTVSFPDPAAAASVTGPILAMRHAGGAWYGRSRLHSERSITAARFSLIEDGPASQLYEARYSFSGEGEYVCRIRISHDLPYPLITEEFDLGAGLAGNDHLVLELGANWNPDTYRYMYGGFGGGEGPLTTGAIESTSLSGYLTIRQAEWAAWPSAGAPRPPQPGGTGLVFLDRLTHTGAFGPRSAIGLSQGAQSAYILPMQGGAWRRGMSITAWHDPATGVALAFPISVREMQAFLDVTADTSPFATLSHDSSLPATYGRRVWAWCCNLNDTEVASVHQRAGVIGLDRYKDWVVDWAQDPDKLRPLAQTTPAHVARLRTAIASHPERDRLETCYLITGYSADATASANLALAQLRTLSDYISSWQRNWAFFNYRDPDFALFAIRAEDALAYPGLPAALRQELRMRLALFAYWMREPDLTQMGTGTHLGTVNMRFGRWLAGLNFASLLPDHPRYNTWMGEYAGIVRFLMSANTSPGGAWFEPPTYQVYGPTRWLSTAQTILRNAGFLSVELRDHHLGMMRYLADLTMPDPRYPGKRIIPGMGDSGNTLEAMFGIGSNVYADVDAQATTRFRHLHALNGIDRLVSRPGFPGDATLPTYSFLYEPGQEQGQPLATTYIPGYGVAFRAHAGHADETALLFRCGYTRSHWAVDDLNVILAAKGAPLAPGPSYQYYHGVAGQVGPIRNQCRLGSPTADLPNGRIHTDVQEYGFGLHADYAVGRMYHSGEELADGKGEQEWRRHILFLKSQQPAGANYFVLRDTFPGYEGVAANTGRNASWTWVNLGTAERVRVNGTAFNPAQVANEAVTSPASWPSLNGNTIEMGTAHGASSWFWFDTPTTPSVRATVRMNYTVDPSDYQRSWQSRQDGIPAAGSAESSTVFRIDGNANSGFFYVLYPRKGNEATPNCSRLAPGALRIVTAESTDHVFIGDQPFNLTTDDLRFTGTAGSLRVFPDRIVFVMSAGEGLIGYKGHQFRGVAPFERTVMLSDLTPSLTELGGVSTERVTVEIGEGITVSGSLPFTAELVGQSIHIETQGRARPFVVANLPTWLRNAEFTLDGQEFLALRSDEASQNWGRFARSSGIACSTLDGDRSLVIRPRSQWPNPGPSPIPVTIAASIPDAPADLIVQAVSSSRITLAWSDRSNNETSFRIERRAAGEPDFSLLATVGAQISSFIDRDLSPNSLYAYRVRAANSAGASAPSNTISATTLAPPPPPAAPSALVATAVGYDRIALSWTDNASTEEAYLVERRSAGSYEQIATLAAGSTSYLDSGLSPETLYRYRVRALADGVVSAASNEASAITLPLPPPPVAPTSLIANATSSTRVNLHWQDASSDETSFLIERAVADAAFSLLTTLPANSSSYQDEAVSPATSYVYRVRARNEYGDSTFSNVASVTTWAVTAMPQATPPAGAYDTTRSLTLRSADRDAVIRYTTDGSQPTAEHGFVFTVPILLSGSSTIRAIAVAPNQDPSPVLEAAYTIGEPIWLGQLHNNDVPARGTELEASLRAAGCNILLYGDSQTDDRRPGWWQQAAQYQQLSGTRVVYAWNGVRWNGSNRLPLTGEGDNRGGTARITITPSVIVPTTRTMAVILSAWDSAPMTSAQLTSITSGGVTTVFNRSLSASAGSASVGLVRLQVRPGQPIVITLVYPNVSWSGMSLAFQDAAEAVGPRRQIRLGLLDGALWQHDLGEPGSEDGVFQEWAELDAPRDHQFVPVPVLGLPQ